jgi:hypothetical protein
MVLYKNICRRGTTVKKDRCSSSETQMLNQDASASKATRRHKLK